MEFNISLVPPQAKFILRSPFPQKVKKNFTPIVLLPKGFFKNTGLKKFLKSKGLRKTTAPN